MGAHGPVPKRTDQRRRVNKPAIPVTEAPAAEKPSMPPADDRWHPAAKAWYESLAVSGQSKFYEPSDWATAWIVAESLSRDLKPRFCGLSEDGPVLQALPISGSSLSGYLRASAVLLVTEGDRRRLSVELQRPAPAGEKVPDGVADFQKYADRLSG